jgi:hypothetical protein
VRTIGQNLKAHPLRRSQWPVLSVEQRYTNSTECRLALGSSGYFLIAMAHLIRQHAPL